LWKSSEKLLLWLGNEKKETIKFAVDVVNKRIPVIAGTGGNCTKTSIELSVWAESIGVDGLLLVTPYYNKTTQKGLIEHFKVIANSVNIPIILYNVPTRTGLNINPETYLELSKIENIVATKEASGNISQIAEIANLCRENLNIYSGNDDQILPILSLRWYWSYFSSF
jgi:4-hydroxy-tetrahydrodipicolinate synthase